MFWTVARLQQNAVEDHVVHDAGERKQSRREIDETGQDIVSSEAKRQTKRKGLRRSDPTRRQRTASGALHIPIEIAVDILIKCGGTGGRKPATEKRPHCETQWR